MRKDWMKVKVGLAIVFLIALAGFTLGIAPARASGVPPGAEESPEFKAKLQEIKEKQSYAVGVETGRNFLRQKMELDTDMVAKGMKDAMTGGELKMSDQQMLEALYSFTATWKSKQEIASRLKGLDNKKEGEDFLAQNKTREGVVTLPDGLQYKVITEGKGRKPSDTDTVQINYRGSLIDGTEFVNTAGSPETTRVSDPLHLVVGLREAIQLMPVGSRWQIFVPHNLAYGFRPAGQFIGANSTLIYEVELQAIK